MKIVPTKDYFARFLGTYLYSFNRNSHFDILYEDARNIETTLDSNEMV